MEEENIEEIKEVEVRVEKEVPNDMIFVFSPMDIEPKDYRKTYPELNSIPEFEDIPNIDLVFIWYLENPTSPLFWKFKQKSHRIQKAIEKVYDNTLDKKKKNDLLNQHFSPQWRQAMERMRQFGVDERYKAKKMIQKIFKDFEDVLSKPMNDFIKHDGTIDTKAYVSIRSEITDMLPDLIKKVELGFAVKVQGEQEEKEQMGQKYIENFLKEKRNI